MPGLKHLFRNRVSAEGAKALTIKAWAPKARMLMPTSGRYVRLCVRLTILNLLKVYMNLVLRFFHLNLFKVLKQIMSLWIKWIMERCYPHLWWYFFHASCKKKKKKTDIKGYFIHLQITFWKWYRNKNTDISEKWIWLEKNEICLQRILEFENF